MAAADSASQFAAARGALVAGWQHSRRLLECRSGSITKNTHERGDRMNRMNGKELPLRNHTERALSDYFTSLNGHRPARLYDLVLREVEEPLFRAVLDYASATRAAPRAFSGSIAARCARSCAELGLAE
jgi:Fis family transcriptional regulator, factor for inversion stimulation protein